MTNRKFIAAAALLAFASSAALAETTANGAVTNNYLWRGLTQSNNEVAVSGGIDWTSDSGFYVGTWVSNVEYASDDTFSYEHDVYFGYSGGKEDFTYDVGWLYYNYDDVNNIDFHEIYGSLGWGGFSVTAYVLSGTEADEPVPSVDFDFGSTTYLSLDYTFETESGLVLGLHAGRHDGDFNDYFNFGEADPTTDFTYTDYSFSIGIDAFTFTISDTDLDEMGPDSLDNDDLKFVVSYGMEFSF